MQLIEAYEQCKAVIDRHSSTFSTAFATLPLEDRQAVWAIYAFCRTVDDIVDEGDFPLDVRLTHLHRFKSQFIALLNGNPDHTNPLWFALDDVFHRYSMDENVFFDMIKGQEMDLVFSQPATIEDLEKYCYHVAGTVGLMLLPILHPNADPSIKNEVVSLGLAMQLTNILRDVAEDAAMERIYLPVAWMKKYHVTNDMIQTNSPYQAHCKPLFSSIAERANAYYAKGLSIAYQFPPHSRPSLLLSGLLYQAILTKIIDQDYAVLQGRTYIDDKTKLRILHHVQASNLQDHVAAGLEA